VFRNQNPKPRRRRSTLTAFAYAAIVLLSIVPRAIAQTEGPNPCGKPGEVVYDPYQGVCWLANANPAGNPNIVAMMGVANINPNGSMDYATALNWVAALNSFNNKVGYLGHKDWQLPATPLQDSSCADLGPNGASFGPLCTASGMGSLYYLGLRQTFPNSVAPLFGLSLPPLYDVELSYYWALQNNGPNTGGREVFSFANGQRGGTTTKDSYHYVLPMVAAALDGVPKCSSKSALVLPYTQGHFAGRAVFDCNTGNTWLADASLAARNLFGIQGTITLQYGSRTITVPKINGGAMLFDTAPQWIAALNNDTSYSLGPPAWNLPATYDQPQQLFKDLNLTNGDARIMRTGVPPFRSLRPPLQRISSFQNLQPFFYWACVRDQSGNSQSPCNGSTAPENLQFTFNFDYGFQSTSALDQRFFVMVYYPAPVLHTQASLNAVQWSGDFRTAIFVTLTLVCSSCLFAGSHFLGFRSGWLSTVVPVSRRIRPLLFFPWGDVGEIKKLIDRVADLRRYPKSFTSTACP
jgi:hypothetical protein